MPADRATAAAVRRSRSTGRGNGATRPKSPVVPPPAEAELRRVQQGLRNASNTAASTAAGIANNTPVQHQFRRSRLALNALKATVMDLEAHCIRSTPPALSREGSAAVSRAHAVMAAQFAQCSLAFTDLDYLQQEERRTSAAASAAVLSYSKGEQPQPAPQQQPAPFPRDPQTGLRRPTDDWDAIFGDVAFVSPWHVGFVDTVEAYYHRNFGVAPGAGFVRNRLNRLRSSAGRGGGALASPLLTGNALTSSSAASALVTASHISGRSNPPSPATPYGSRGGNSSGAPAGVDPRDGISRREGTILLSSLRGELQALLAIATPYFGVRLPVADWSPAHVMHWVADSVELEELAPQFVAVDGPSLLSLRNNPVNVSQAVGAIAMESADRSAILDALRRVDSPTDGFDLHAIVVGMVPTPQGAAGEVSTARQVASMLQKLHFKVQLILCSNPNAVKTALEARLAASQEAEAAAAAAAGGGSPGVASMAARRRRGINLFFFSGYTVRLPDSMDTSHKGRTSQRLVLDCGRRFDSVAQLRAASIDLDYVADMLDAACPLGSILLVDSVKGLVHSQQILGQPLPWECDEGTASLAHHGIGNGHADMYAAVVSSAPPLGLPADGPDKRDPSKVTWKDSHSAFGAALISNLMDVVSASVRHSSPASTGFSTSHLSSVSGAGGASPSPTAASNTPAASAAAAVTTSPGGQRLHRLLSKVIRSVASGRLDGATLSSFSDRLPDRVVQYQVSHLLATDAGFLVEMAHDESSPAAAAAVSQMDTPRGRSSRSSSAVGNPAPGLAVRHSTQRRVAFILSVTNYDSGQANGPLYSARAAEAGLRTIGFEIVSLHGPSPDALEAELSQFLDAMDSNTIAVIFWAAYFAHAFDSQSQRVVNYCLVTPDDQPATQTHLRHGGHFQLDRLTNRLCLAPKYCAVLLLDCYRPPWAAEGSGNAVGLAAGLVAPRLLKDTKGLSVQLSCSASCPPEELCDPGAARESPLCSAFLSTIAKPCMGVEALCRGTAAATPGAPWFSFTCESGGEVAQTEMTVVRDAGILFGDEGLFQKESWTLRTAEPRLTPEQHYEVLGDALRRSDKVVSLDLSAAVTMARQAGSLGLLMQSFFDAASAGKQACGRVTLESPIQWDVGIFFPPLSNAAAAAAASLADENDHSQADAVKQAVGWFEMRSDHANELFFHSGSETVNIEMRKDERPVKAWELTAGKEERVAWEDDSTWYAAPNGSTLGQSCTHEVHVKQLYGARREAVWKIEAGGVFCLVNHSCRAAPDMTCGADLSDVGITNLDLQLMALALPTASNVTALDLSGNTGLDKVGLATLVDALRVSKSITSLSLSRNQMSPDMASCLGTALRAGILRSLDLSWCITEVGEGSDMASCLAKAMKSCPSLRDLNLSHNLLGNNGMGSGPSGLIALFKSLESVPALTRLDLVCSDLEDRSAIALVGLATNHKSLKRIDLRGNTRVSTLGTDRFAACIKDLKLDVMSMVPVAAIRADAVTELDYTGQDGEMEPDSNFCGGPNGARRCMLSCGFEARVLGSLLASNMSVTSLCIPNHRPRGVHLVDLRNQCEGLESSDMGNDELDVHCDWLTSAVKGRTSLQKLDISAMADSPAESVLLQMTLKHLPHSLTHLNVSSNHLGLCGLPSTIEPNLTHLDCSDNSLRDQGVARLASCLGRSITFLDVSNNGILYNGSCVLLEDLTLRSPALHTLKMSNNQLDLAGTKQLSTLVGGAKHLQCLHIAGTSLKAQCATMLAASVIQNNSLTELDVHSNDMQRDGAQALADAVTKSLPRLASFRLSPDSFDSSSEGISVELKLQHWLDHYRFESPLEAAH